MTSNQPLACCMSNDIPQVACSLIPTPLAQRGHTTAQLEPLAKQIGKLVQASWSAPIGWSNLMLMHGRPLVYRLHAFWHRWTVAEGAVGPDGVVVMPPALDQDLRLAEGVEDLPVEQLIPETGVEAFAVAVFPG